MQTLNYKSVAFTTFQLKALVALATLWLKFVCYFSVFNVLRIKKSWCFCLTPWYAHVRTCAYQGVRNVRFSENLAYFVFLKHPFWDSLFCLITNIVWQLRSEESFRFRLIVKIRIFSASNYKTKRCLEGDSCG